ncbi:hypothetical protein QBC38DRAFT_482711, partial [Podospora fimiseda]
MTYRLLGPLTPPTIALATATQTCRPTTNNTFPKSLFHIIMAPRKKAKPNPAVAEEVLSLPTTMPSQLSSSSFQARSASRGPTASLATPISIPAPRQPSPRGSKQNGSGDRAPASAPASKQVNKTKSWYGSLPRKAVASTAVVACETILGGTSKPKATADFSRFEIDPKKTPDAMSIDGHHDESRVADAQKPEPPSDQDADVKPPSKTVTEETEEEPTAPSSTSQTEPSPPKPNSTWLGGWWGKSPTLQVVEAQTVTPPEAPPPQDAPIPQAPVAAPVEANPPEPVKEVEPEPPVPKRAEAPNGQPMIEIKQRGASGGSWLWSWSGKTTPPPPESQQTEDQAAEASTTEPQAAAPSIKEPEDITMEDAPPIEGSPSPAPKAGSTWAFWSRDTGSAPGKKPTQQNDQGQLAVMGESSQNRPTRQNSMEFRGTPPKEPSISSGKGEDSKSVKKEDQIKAAAAVPYKPASLRRTKRDRPDSMDVDEIAPSRPDTPKAEPPAVAGKLGGPKTPAKASAPNLVLPSFKSTYKLKENPSIVKQITRLLLRGQQAPAKHVYLTKEPPKIKKAIAIGVHGLFPANYLRPMIGQPTGTSIKFANHSAEAIRRWADSHGCQDCEIEKVALEGEGKIGERVENLWKLLLNWIDQIRSADFILIGCHSQGVPVSIMLLAKLIEMGVVAGAKVGVCAMAGVSLGPFPDSTTSKLGYLMGSAGELWTFADPQSEVSQRLEASVKVCLGYGARITYVGSIDDQLVPLE